ncbi:MAG: preprotein translocase subunit SecA, partial [Dehalococcoidia bacterium]|nr:preprotein translocase subunit SecA [Dehalococcoidia bacterium]
MVIKGIAKILGGSNERVVKRLSPVAEAVNDLEAETAALDNPSLRAKTDEFRRRLDSGETPDDLLPEAFAVVREAARRAIGLRHFDVQIVGGVVLHQGRIAEMKTGEGKTLVATLAAYLNALGDGGVHVVTVNDYLARRDAAWMGAVYHLLGMTTTALQNQGALAFRPGKDNENGAEAAEVMTPCSRQEAYRADITYGTNAEFGFDYLRDNMVAELDKRVQRPLSYAIVDEVDNILIDEARTPLIISGPAQDSPSDYQKFSKLVPQLSAETDFTVDEKHRAVSLSAEGIDRMERLLRIKDLYGEDNLRTVAFVENALKARVLFERDRDYVVKDGEVVIVDEFTGRLMPGRRYSEGLHQALEAKEGLRVQRESITYATITLQNYFRLYEKLAGMTGTAATEAEEFWKIYKLDVVVIPPNRANARTDGSDLIYSTEQGKWRAVVDEIEDRHRAGQPVLVGTVDIAKSEHLSDMLKRRRVRHEVLNAKHHEREAQIVAEAGRPGAVTVATNMAGRGTDIILGGSPDSRSEGEWRRDHERVVDAGGLHVIGTERHEARRIDNQLRGRSARQGDPGSTRFYVSLEDDLMRRFAGDRIKSIMTWTGIDEDTPLENKMITKTIENAQVKVEAHHFDTRKHLVDYDDVVNTHREVIYEERDKVLKGADIKANILKMVETEISEIVSSHVGGLSPQEWDPEPMIKELGAILPLDRREADADGLYRASSEEIEQRFVDIARRTYEGRETELTPELMRVIERHVMLRVIDMNWVQHLTSIEHLRQGIGLYAYGQRDPLVMYKKEARDHFDDLLAKIRHDVVHAIYHMAPVPAGTAARPGATNGAQA